jgi:hypothetical protein
MGNAGGAAEECLSALFVDFDNVYLSLHRRNPDAAGRFARNPQGWLNRISTGGLVRFKHHRPTWRRFPVARCYGNPGRTRISRGGPNDPHGFATVRSHFMMAGIEVIDCQPLSSQFKNGTDIKIACDIRDFLEHSTRFDEFIILSGDADFTPVLHHLRSHDRRTVVYANESTADIYKAFSDGWIDEQDLITFLLEEGPPALLPNERAGMRGIGYDGQRLGALPDMNAGPMHSDQGGGYGSMPQQAPAGKRPVTGQGVSTAVQSLIDDFQTIGAEILNLVMEIVRTSDKPVPIAYLADRAQKVLGHAKTVGTNWAGSGQFINFLNNTLAEPMRLTDKPPHFVYDMRRHRLDERFEAAPPPVQHQQHSAPKTAVAQRQPDQNATKYTELQHSITRIYDASKAPPLPPSEYQVLFSMIATEVTENGFNAMKTGQAVIERAQRQGVRLAMKDVAFVLDAIDEMDPWLDRTRSPGAVARAYRDFVLAKCQAAGLRLSEDELQLIQVWFGASQWTGSPQGPASNAGYGQQGGGSGGGYGQGGVDAGRGRDPRGYGGGDAGALPDYRTDYVPDNDYAYDQDEGNNHGIGGQRFSFLKH